MEQDVLCIPCADDFDLPSHLSKRPRCERNCGHDCGHHHMDASAPGLIGGVALPALRLTLVMSCVTAAAAASNTAATTGPATRAVQVFGLSLISIVLLRALVLSKSVGVPSPSAEDTELVNQCLSKQDEYAQRLSAALQCKTISWDKLDTENQVDWNEFRKLRLLLEIQFPLVHKELKRTVINNHSLIYEWQGTDESELPYMVYAHMDVVPTPEEEKWKVHPWSGRIKDGFIWGRGAIDDKHALLGHLEAVEDLLASGFKPRRSIFLCFGHDEEVTGLQGAKKIAEHFIEKEVRFEFMLDEGLFILDGAVPGFTKPVAMVCVAEKGYATVRLKVECEPGHASQPPPEGAIGILSRALSKLEKNPFPTSMSVAHRMFRQLQGGFAWPLHLVLCNMWLFTGVVKTILAAKPASSTLVRTTTALTVMNSGVKENVLPSKAEALVNHRIHPDDTIAGVLDRDKRIINDPRVKLEIVGTPTPPSPISSFTHPAYKTIADCVHSIFPGNAVAPGLFVAASDSKHFWSLTPQIYRFNPVTLHVSETVMFHGFDERIGVENYAKLVAFFRKFHVMQSSRPAVVENGPLQSKY